MRGLFNSTQFPQGSFVSYMWQDFYFLIIFFSFEYISVHVYKCVCMLQCSVYLCVCEFMCICCNKFICMCSCVWYSCVCLDLWKPMFRFAYNSSHIEAQCWHQVLSSIFQCYIYWDRVSCWTPASPTSQHALRIPGLCFHSIRITGFL